MTSAATLLRTARKRARLSQRALAQSAGTSQSVVQRIESGRVQPSIETLSKLLRATGHELIIDARPLGPDAVSADPGGLRGQLRAYRARILDVTARHGAHNVRVFGSVARGDHREDSDIDLLVDFDDGRSIFDLIRAEHELAEVLGAPVHVVSAKGLRDRDRHVIEEAMPLVTASGPDTRIALLLDDLQDVCAVAANIVRAGAIARRPGTEDTFASRSMLSRRRTTLTKAVKLLTLSDVDSMRRLASAGARRAASRGDPPRRAGGLPWAYG